MKSINKVILIGNVGGEVKVNYTAAGMAITSFGLATNEQWTDKQSGEKQERTAWHNVVCFGKLAEIAGKYVGKGDALYIEGSIQYDTYTDKEGVQKTATKIKAETMSMLGSKGQRGEAPASRPPTPRAPAPSAPADNGFTDDEIPF